MLAETIGAPAFDLSGDQFGAGEVLTAHDLDRGYGQRHVHRHHAGVNAGGRTQLQELVRPPTLHRAGRQNGAGMIPPRADPYDIAESGNNHRRRGIVERTVSELAIGILAPATHCRVGEQRTVEILSSDKIHRANRI